MDSKKKLCASAMASTLLSLGMPFITSGWLVAQDGSLSKANSNEPTSVLKKRTDEAPKSTVTGTLRPVVDANKFSPVKQTKGSARLKPELQKPIVQKQAASASEGKPQLEAKQKLQTRQKPEPKPVNDDSLDAEQLFALAATQYGDQNWRAAIEQFRSLLKTHPNSPLVEKSKFYLGESLVQINQNSKAEELFTKFLVEHPKSAYAKRTEFRLAECQYLDQKYATAKAGFEKFMDAHGQDPLAEFALPYLGELNLRFANHDEARKAYQQALRRFPGSTLSDKCRLGLAQSLQRLGDLNEAQRFYRFLADQFHNPLGDDARLMLGKSYAEKNNWVQAKQEFDLVVRKYPESDLKVEAKYLTAKMEMLQNNFAESWEGFQPLLKQEIPDSLFGKLALDASIVAVRLDRLDEASDLIKRLRSSKETTDASIQEFAAVLEIDIANRRKNLDSLATLVGSFEKQFPNSIHITRCIEPLARMHYEQGDYEKSTVRYEQLIDLVTKRPDLVGNLPAWRYLMGLSNIGTGNHSDALAQLKQIKDFGDEVSFKAATSFAIATAYSGLKRYSESIPHYKQYQLLNPKGADSNRCAANLAIAHAKANSVTEAVAALTPVLNATEDRDSILGACEIVAEAALKAKDKTTAKRMFKVLAESGIPKFAARGTNGLIWSGDDQAVSSEQLQTVMDTGLDNNLVAEAVIAKVQRLQADNKHQESIDVLNQVIKAYPNSPYIDEANFRLAISMQRLGGEINSRSAVTLLQGFLKNQPKHELADLARYELAWALHDSADIVSARNAFEKIADDHPESEFRIDAAYRTAMLYKQTGSNEQARLWLEQLLVWSPKHNLANYAHYSLGENKGANGNWSDALPHFKHVVDQAGDPKLVQPAKYWYAESLYQTGQLDQAEDHFDALRSVEFPETEIRSVIWLRLAQCAARRADWSSVERIVNELRSNTSIESDSWQLDYLQGRVMMSRAQFKEAREAFGTVLKNDEAKGTQTAAMSQWMIGESWFHQEEYKQALRAYLLVDSLYDYDQWRSLSLLQAAKCHLKMGDAKQAKITCDRLVKSFPNSSHIVQARSLIREISATNGADASTTLPAKWTPKPKK